jgi:hypothetical protein
MIIFFLRLMLFFFTGEFGCLVWNHSETHLLYVAEKKVPESKSYFDRKAMKEVEEGKPGILMVRQRFPFS